MTDYHIETTAVIEGTEEVLEYSLDLIQNLDDKGDIPVSTIATNKPENAQHIAFSGKSQEAEIEMIIYDDGTDKSRGTYSSSNIDDPRINSTNEAGDTIVKTVSEQIVWITRYIHSSSFGADWQMYGGRFDTPDQSDDPVIEPGTDIALTKVNVTETADNPLRAQANFSIKWGNII